MGPVRHRVSWTGYMIVNLKKEADCKTHTLVGGSDRVVLVVGARGAANLVLPPCADAGTSGDLNDVVVLDLDVRIASNVGVVDVLNGVVAVGGADALELALVLAVD